MRWPGMEAAKPRLVPQTWALDWVFTCKKNVPKGKGPTRRSGACFNSLEGIKDIEVCYLRQIRWLCGFP